MKVTFLGTGTSHGIPVPGCGCSVCTSGDPRDTRYRSAVLVEVPQGHAGTQKPLNILIDTPPELRLQLLRAQVTRLDAVLITHSHADHLHGLDDVRPLSTGQPLPVWADKRSIGEIRTRFGYIFKPFQTGGGLPSLNLQALRSSQSALLEGLTITPVPLMHGKLPIFGWRIGNFAYCTDCSGIPDASLKLLRGLDTLVLGGLRHRPHPTHFNIEQAISAARALGPRRLLLTHIAHEILHDADNAKLPAGVQLAHDGLTLTVA